MNDYCIIPDIHSNLNLVLRALDIPAQRYIFLGDWFDKFDSQPGDMQETLRWLIANKDNPSYTFLLGNHDMHYHKGYSQFGCSGFNSLTSAAIKEQCPDLFKGFSLFSWANDFLCSHAGLHESLLNGKRLTKKLISQMETQALATPHTSRLFAPGQARGGWHDKGGVTWLDWEQEFKPIKGVYQIVGHSTGKEVREKSGNYCIDTGKDVALVNGGEITFQEIQF